MSAMAEVNLPARNRRQSESRSEESFSKEVQGQRGEVGGSAMTSQVKAVNPAQISWMGTCETSPPAEVLSCQKLEASLQMQSLRSFQGSVALPYPNKYGLDERAVRQHEAAVDTSREPQQHSEAAQSRDHAQFGAEALPSNYYQRQQPNTEEQYSQLNQAGLEPPVTHFLAQASADPLLFQQQSQFPNNAPVFRPQHHSSAVYRQSHLSAEAPPFCHQSQQPEQSTFQAPSGASSYLPNEPPVDNTVLYQQQNQLPVDSTMYQRPGEGPVYHQSNQSASEASLYHSNRASVDAPLYHHQNHRPSESSVFREAIQPLPEGPMYHQTVSAVEAALYRSQRRSEASMYHHANQAATEPSMYHHSNQPSAEAAVYHQEAAMYHHSNPSLSGAPSHFLHQSHSGPPQPSAFYHQNQGAPDGTTFYRYQNQAGDAHYQRQSQPNAAYYHLQNQAAAEAQFRHQQNQPESSFHLLQNQRPVEPRIHNSGPVDAPFYPRRNLEVDAQLCHQNHPVSEAQVFQYQNQSSQGAQHHQQNRASAAELPVFQYQNQIGPEAPHRQSTRASMDMSIVNYQSQAGQENRLHAQNHTRAEPTLFDYQSQAPQDLQSRQQNRSATELPMYPYQNQTSQEALLRQPSLVIGDTPASQYPNQARSDAQHYHQNQRGSPLKHHRQSQEAAETKHVHSKRSAENGLPYANVAPDDKAVSNGGIATSRGQHYRNDVTGPQCNGQEESFGAFQQDRRAVDQNKESNDQYKFKCKPSDERKSPSHGSLPGQAPQKAACPEVKLVDEPDIAGHGNVVPEPEPEPRQVILNGSFAADGPRVDNLAPINGEDFPTKEGPIQEILAAPEPNLLNENNMPPEVMFSDEDEDYDFTPTASNQPNNACYFEQLSPPHLNGSERTSPTECVAEVAVEEAVNQDDENLQLFDENPSPEGSPIPVEMFSPSNAHLLPRPPDILLTLPVDDEGDSSSPGNQSPVESANDNDGASTPSAQLSLSQDGSDVSGPGLGFLFDCADEVDLPLTPPPTPPSSPPLLTPPCETPPPYTPPLLLHPSSPSPLSSTLSSPRSMTPPFSSPLSSSPRTGEGDLPAVHSWEHFKAQAEKAEMGAEPLPQCSLVRALDMLSNKAGRVDADSSEPEQPAEADSASTEANTSSETKEEVSSPPSDVEADAASVDEPIPEPSQQQQQDEPEARTPSPSATCEESLPTDQVDSEPVPESPSQSSEESDDQKQDLGSEETTLAPTADDATPEQDAVSLPSEPSDETNTCSVEAAVMPANADDAPACTTPGQETTQQAEANGEAQAEPGAGAEEDASSPRPPNQQQTSAPIRVHGFHAPRSHGLKL